MIDEALKILNKAFSDLPIEEGKDCTSDRILEVITILENYTNADKILKYVLEHCTLSQVVYRCRNAVVDAFGDDYRELTIRKEKGK